MIPIRPPSNFKNSLVKLVVFVLLILNSFSLLAQESPPQPISVFVNTDQELSFGAFYPINSGGSITVSATGARTTSGDVIPINQGFTYSPALFEVQALPGTIIHVQVGSAGILTGSNGGTMNLITNDSNPGSPFISNAVPPARTDVRIGGTLTVGSIQTNKAGNYVGTFTVTFDQE